MSSSYGENLRLTVFGQSHSKAIGMVLEGIPANNEIDTQKLNKFLARRAPGKNKYSTPRLEADEPEFLSGMVDNKTCGAPISAVIYNQNTRSQDYENLKTVPRPSHADYTAQIKYFGAQDVCGGGHFSGRLTAPMCISGGICLQLLEKEGIQVFARIKSIGNVEDDNEFDSSVADKEFPTVSEQAGEKMKKLIEQKRLQGDSVGGIIECIVLGLPAGLGDPMFDGMENKISQIVFGIPAIKGIEFGLGFACAQKSGSENNDEFCIVDGKIQTKTNNCGGILGGITNGMPLVFRVAVKPTPSIAIEQNSVDLIENKETTLKIEGRHDPCIVPRAVPCVEAAAAIAVYDALLSRRKEMGK